VSTQSDLCLAASIADGYFTSSNEVRSRFALVAVTAANGRGQVGRRDEYPSSMIEVVLRNGRVLRLSECAMPSRMAPLADALEEYRS
jgi:hypothetical protein